MIERRCYVSACTLGEGHLMAMGGYNDRHRLASTEVLDLHSNIWSLGKRMTAIR